MSNGGIDTLIARWPSSDGSSLFGSASDGSSQSTDLFDQIESLLDQLSSDASSDDSDSSTGLSGSGASAASDAMCGGAAGGAAAEGGDATTAHGHSHHSHRGRHSHGTTADNATTNSTTDSATTGSVTDGLTVNGNTIETKNYLITPSTDEDGSFTVTDKSTGAKTTIWGDPHVTNKDGAQVADFQDNNLDLSLPDGTDINVETTAPNSDGKSHIARVTATNGGTTATITATTAAGIGSGFTVSGAMATGHRGGADGLRKDTDDTLLLDSNNNLYTEDPDGNYQAVTANSDGTPMQLDDVDHPSESDSDTDDSSTMSDQIAALKQEIEEWEQGQELRQVYDMLFNNTSSSGLFNPLQTATDKNTNFFS